MKPKPNEAIRIKNLINALKEKNLCRLLNMNFIWSLIVSSTEILKKLVFDSSAFDEY